VWDLRHHCRLAPASATCTFIAMSSVASYIPHTIQAHVTFALNASSYRLQGGGPLATRTTRVANQPINQDCRGFQRPSYYESYSLVPALLHPFQALVFWTGYLPISNSCVRRQLPPSSLSCIPPQSSCSGGSMISGCCRPIQYSAKKKTLTLA
jgi:hypothetical protein